MSNTSLFTTHPQSFVHLHLHTQYSLLDGAIRIKDLVKKAKELGMPAVASTDHGNMFGAIDFYKSCKEAGIKPLLGSEIYFTPGSRFERQLPKRAKVVSGQDEEEGKHHIHHLILLCKNLTGYRNLCQLISRAYMEGFYYKPRADMDLLRQYSEGLVCTTACLKGEVGYNFFSGQDERAVSAIKKLHELFGEDFYLEVQENGLPEQAEVNKKVIEYARNNGMNVVATNDCHYLDKEDSAAQEVLLCIQTGKTFSDEQRMKLSTSEFYVKSPEQMRESFHYLPEACDNTLKIADKCNLDFKWTDDQGRMIYQLPKFVIETNETEADYFIRMSVEGLEKRFAGPHFRDLVAKPEWATEIRPKYVERLHEEAQMIIKMGFTGYFLIVSDFIKWSKSNQIPVGPGRGSGAGSLVAYSLEITNLDPICYNLLFERFINPERISMPDFDVDFCQDRRQEVIDYVTRKYGEERVAQIITFGKLQAKAVIRDVSRVFGLPYSEIDMLAKLIPEELGITLDEAIHKEPKLQELEASDPKVRQIIKISRRLEGLLRHASIHAAGVIITDEPIVNYCPLFRGREGERVVQFDKDFSEAIGLVKFDFLGLKTLTVIENASQFIRRDHQADFDIENIHLADPNVYKMISAGNTTGVFQLESSGMKDLCKRLAPDNIEDITAINALYRPGPLGSGMVDDFIEIKHGRKETKYPFKELTPVLKDTYGIIVYQEQVMNIARIVGGYSLGQADILRRAMGKKKKEVMDEHCAIFCKGAKERNFDVDKAKELFDLMAMFAEYGFNKSHAVAYAYIAYQTAYLKHYFPGPFYAALLSTEMGNTDKVTAYIADAKVNGMEILPPDINESLWSFNVLEKSNIRFGMGAVKNVGKGAVEEIIREREAAGPFTSFLNFCERIQLNQVNRRVLESLIRVGAFDQCDPTNRKTLLENLDLMLAFAEKKQEEKQLGQVNLFSFDDGSQNKNVDATFSAPEIKHVEDFDSKEKLSQEKQLLGIFVSGHPLDKFEGVIKQMTSMSLADLHELPGADKRDMVIAGLIVETKKILTKKGDKMAFVTLEDLSGKIECIVFPRTYSEFEGLLSSEDPVIMQGQVNLAENPRKFFPTKIQMLKEQAEDRVSGVRIRLPLQGPSPHMLPKLRQLLLCYRGSVPTQLILDGPMGRAVANLGEEFLVNPTPQLAARINELIGENCVQFVVDAVTPPPQRPAQKNNEYRRFQEKEGPRP